MWRAAVRNGAGAGECTRLLQGTLHTRVPGPRTRYVCMCAPGKPKAAGTCAISAHCKECVALPRRPHQLGLGVGAQTPEAHVGLCSGHCDFSQVRACVTGPGCMMHRASTRCHCQEAPRVQPRLRASGGPRVDCFPSVVGLSSQSQGLSGRSSVPCTNHRSQRARKTPTEDQTGCQIPIGSSGELRTVPPRKDRR